MFAMSFGRWEAVELLLDNGADPTAKDENKMDALMHAGVHGRAVNIENWLLRLPDWDLERKNKFGHTVLASALSFGGDKRDTVEVLLNAKAHMPALALHCLAHNPDGQHVLVKWLLGVDDGKLLSKLDLRNRPPSVLWHLIYMVVRNRLSIGKKII